MSPSPSVSPSETLSYARVRAPKVFNPCHRCRLAKLFENQCVVGGNEVTTVTRKGYLLIEMPPITVADAFAHREERHLSERGNITIFNRRHYSL